MDTQNPVPVKWPARPSDLRILLWNWTVTCRACARRESSFLASSGLTEGEAVLLSGGVGNAGGRGVTMFTRYVNLQSHNSELVVQRIAQILAALNRKAERKTSKTKAFLH